MSRLSPRALRPALAGVLLAGLCACTVGPTFHAPAVDAPAQWGAEPQAASATYAGQIDSAWWDSFHDAELSSLVHRLATQNLDLKVAAERIDQARNERKIAASQGLPQIHTDSTYTHTRLSPTGMVALLTPAPGAPLEYNMWENDVSVSWELDLFGRVRRSVEAAQANTEVEEEARHGLALATIADLAADYMQLRDVQARIVIARQDLELTTRNLALVDDRFRNGVA
ncbi:MAG: TolC family protein, partial [Caulobacteraceae bacterium]